LALAELHLEDFDAAGATISRAMAMERERAPGTSVEYLDLLNVYCEVLYRTGKSDAAIAIMQEVIDTYAAEQGEAGHSIHSLRANLATLLSGAGRHEEAATILRHELAWFD